jgi:hypothetical protein
LRFCHLPQIVKLLMNAKLERIMKDVAVFRHLYEDTEENHENGFPRIVGDSAKIRSESHPNTNLEQSPVRPAC